MLTALRCHDDEKVLARHAERADGPFLCPACGGEALLVKGRLRVHHFRHRAETVDCRRERGESAQHMACKEAIHAALQGRANVAALELERAMGRSIADVFALIDGAPVAIEIQRSVLGIEELLARTLEYHRQGVFVLWVALPAEDIAFSQYAPRAWERWCHALYGGRVYYWIEGDTLQPVHFDPLRIVAPVYEQRDARGARTQVGGGSYVSRRYRTPNHGPRVRIAEAFAPQVRDAWEAGDFRLPRCSLYVDRMRAWWMAGRPA